MTLNQIIKSITGEVAVHKQINTFYFGQLGEWTNFSGLTYPSCLLVLENANRLANQTRFNFTIYIADLLNHDLKNRTEIHSDTLQILNDLISMLDHYEFDWTLEAESSVEFFDDERGVENPDQVAGVKFSFSIVTDSVKDRCQVPSRRVKVTDQGFLIFMEDGKTFVGLESDPSNYIQAK